ncbi:ThuA domain-containing protein [Pseudonocardia sp. TRM90224]|uniref:ThuA domain-containing protein n=1 Tax=Pseudonocardia sp. TRM90224 TaxID=2812678 RepID=UPI001E317809|nr:ThuA domain-containing protein [Pseudonocardia sp. TRM90224]
MMDALVVRGGWEGHVPVPATELFLPDLAAAGFTVDIADDLDVYLDTERLARTDLIVQCWSEGTLTTEQERGLTAAVHAGTGFAGWHGGVVATFTGNTEYLRMVGGRFLHHPEHFHTYTVRVDRPEHPIMHGIADFDVHSEQYWLLGDDRNDVLAHTVITPETGGQGSGDVRMPVVWTRLWGAGKVFVSAIGHRVADLEVPPVRELTRRGMAWAARTTP